MVGGWVGGGSVCGLVGWGGVGWWLDGGLGGVGMVGRWAGLGLSRLRGWWVVGWVGGWVGRSGMLLHRWVGGGPEDPRTCWTRSNHDIGKYSSPKHMPLAGQAWANVCRCCGGCSMFGAPLSHVRFECSVRRCTHTHRLQFEAFFLLDRFFGGLLKK
jgi:hypothetical protein